MRDKSFKHVRRDSRKGVSPVIGVILMVAATIVIAAVVMAMLGGFGPPKKLYSVAATASEKTNLTDTTKTDITVIFAGGPDADQLRTDTNAFSITINGVSHTPDAGTLLSDTSAYTGKSAVFCQKGTPGANNDHVIATVTFKDLTSQVILNTYV